MPVILAGLSALAFGFGDLLGGVAIRRSGRPGAALGVAMVATLVGAVLIGLLLVVRPPEVVRWEDIVWPVGAGALMVATRPLLYLGMARGPVAVFAPSFGLVMIVVPTIVGPLIGQTLKGIEMAGVALAIPAVVLLSGEGRLPKLGVVLRSPVLGLAAVVGTSVGTAGLLLTQAAPEAGEVPAFVVLVTGVMVMPWILRQRTGSFWPEREILGFGSVLGASSAVAFVLSTAAYLRGSAAVVSALIAMAPVVSVVISWRFLGERLHAVQVLGGAFGMAAVTAFAMAG
ncbi:MAG: DMT family transporter [Acidimicrobiales bacterium]|nr:DMT family transporter [Acidimicrobiales bacterium]